MGMGIYRSCALSRKGDIVLLVCLVSSSLITKKVYFVASESSNMLHDPFYGQSLVFQCQVLFSPISEAEDIEPVIESH
jgi:hypothetical protein